VIITKNFLDPVMAENLYKELMSCPGDWWIKSHVIKGAASVLSDRTLGGTSYDWDGDLTKSLRDGFFTYSFTKSSDHISVCDCFMCNFRQYISFVFKDHIEKNTELQDLVLDEMFFSVYEPGDFLSTHHDKNKGDVAFVLNLTKNWRPEYGGVFHCNGEYVTPEFNSLMFFEIPDEEGIEHFVSEVSKRAPNPRIAVTGWFKSK
jgi:hypothetical protein